MLAVLKGRIERDDVLMLQPAVYSDLPLDLQSTVLSSSQCQYNVQSSAYVSTWSPGLVHLAPCTMLL